MNRVVLVGRLARDPELRRTSSDIPVVQFTLAVNRPFSSQNEDSPKADFISCVVWRQQAENLAKYMHKGSQIAVEGRLQVRSYEDQGGVKRFATEVVCDQIQFLDSKGSSSNGGYRDVNQYDIPDNARQENSNGFEQDNVLEDNYEENEESSNSKLDISEVSDDDLPF